MTCEELYEKYIGIFKVLIKTAGDKEENSSYQKVAHILKEKDSREMIRRAIEDEVDFRIFVSILIFLVMKDVHGIEKLVETDTDKMGELITSMYSLYLRVPTRRFCSENGLPAFNDPEMTCIIHRFKKD